MQRNVDLLDLEKYLKNYALDAKIGVDTAEKEPNMFMAYAHGHKHKLFTGQVREFRPVATVNPGKRRDSE